MGRKPIVMRHISKIDLDKLYKKETNLRIKERLLAIVHLYEGKNVYEVANILKRSERTIKYWLSRWNDQGYSGLIPRNRNGKKPKMSLDEWDEVIKEIEGVTSGPKVHNPGGLKVHTSTSFASNPKGCGDVAGRRVPHVKRSLQTGIEHQRDCPSNGLQSQDRKQIRES